MRSLRALASEANSLGVSVLQVTRSSSDVCRLQHLIPADRSLFSAMDWGCQAREMVSGQDWNPNEPSRSSGRDTSWRSKSAREGVSLAAPLLRKQDPILSRVTRGEADAQGRGSHLAVAVRCVAARSRWAVGRTAAGACRAGELRAGGACPGAGPTGAGAAFAEAGSVAALTGGHPACGGPCPGADPWVHPGRAAAGRPQGGPS